MSSLYTTLSSPPCSTTPPCLIRDQDAAGQDIAPFWETYYHSDDARQLLATMQVGVVQGTELCDIDSSEGGTANVT